MKDIFPECPVKNHTAENGALEAAKKPRTHLLKLLVRTMLRQQVFEFDLLVNQTGELSPKEKLYVAYAMVIAYAFKQHYAHAIKTETSQEKPHIVNAITHTMQPILEARRSDLPLFVAVARDYTRTHSSDGNLTAQSAAETPEIDLMTSASLFMATRVEQHSSSTTKVIRGEVERASRHIAATAPSLDLESLGFKSATELKHLTAIGCPAQLVGLIGLVVQDAITLNEISAQK